MNKVIFVLAIIFSVISAQSLCDKYAAAPQFGNGSVLITVAVTGSVAKILEVPTLKKFFDGSHTVKTNFTGNATAFAKLAGDLISFFSDALGCTDNTTAKYTGRTMAEAHAGMNVTYGDMNAFNNIVSTVVNSAGFDQNDTNAVANALANLTPAICTAPDCMSICNRYSKPYVFNNSKLVGLVVGNVVGAALKSSVLLPFFDGTTPAGSKNFTDQANAADFNNLFQHLVDFFGGALGCSDGSIKPYSGNPDLKAVHAKMPITNAVFTGFNGAVVQVMKDAGVAQADLDVVAQVLEGTRAAICNQADCASNTTDTGATTGGNSTDTTPTTQTPAPTTTTGSASALIIASILALISLLI